MSTNTTWTATATWRPAADDVEAAGERVLEHLAELAPALTLEGGDRPRCAVTLTLQADTIAQAAADTIAAVESAIGDGLTVDGVEIVTRDERDLQLAAPTLPPLVGVSDIADMLEVSRQRAHQLVARPDFPPRAAEVKATPLWLRAHVERWIETWDRRGGRPPKA